MTDTPTLDELLRLRFDDAPQDVAGGADTSHWHSIANHQS